MVGHGIEIGFSGCKWRCRAAQKTGKTCFITGIYHLCGSLNTEHLRRLRDPPKGQIFAREETDTVPRRIPQRGTAEIRFCDVTVTGQWSSPSSCWYSSKPRIEGRANLRDFRVENILDTSRFLWVWPLKSVYNTYLSCYWLASCERAPSRNDSFQQQFHVVCKLRLALAQNIL